MARYITCARCGKKIYEGTTAIRKRGFTGFYCSFRCYALDNEANVAEVTDEIVQEDKTCNHKDWQIE